MASLRTDDVYWSLLHKSHMKSSNAKASKCHLKFSSRIIIFIKRVYLSSVISLKWQWRLLINCHL